jgi:hypothetical protein
MDQDALTPSLDGGCLTPKQLAERWQVGERTLRDWAKRRYGVPVFKLGPKQVRYRLADVQAWEGGHCQKVRGA